MKKRSVWIKRTAAFLLALTMVTGCLPEDIFSVFGSFHAQAAGEQQGTVTLDPSSVTLEKGATTTLKVTDKIDGATYTWTSSSSDVASVNDQGVVTAKSAGSAIITATATYTVTTESDEESTATAKGTAAVTVTEPKADTEPEPKEEEEPEKSEPDIKEDNPAAKTASVKVSHTPGTIYYGDTVAFTVKSDTAGKVTISTSDTSEITLPGTKTKSVKANGSVTFNVTAAKVTDKALVSFAFKPTDTSITSPEISDTKLVVHAIPVKAVWTETQLTRTYDRTKTLELDNTKAANQPAVKLDGVSGYSTDGLSVQFEPTNADDTEQAKKYSFTFNSGENANAGTHKATLQGGKLVLTGTNAENYKLTNAVPDDAVVKVEPIKLTTADVTTEGVEIQDKPFDNTSNAKVKTAPSLSESKNILEGDVVSFGYEKAVYTDKNGNEVVGKVDKDTTAAKVVFSGLKVLNADGSDCPNYVFDKDATITVSGKHTIQKGLSFADMTGLENLREDGWFNQKKTLEKQGISFAVSVNGPWEDSFTINEDNLEGMVYAKNADGEISQGYAYHYDATAPGGQIYATINDDTANRQDISISELNAKLAVFRKNGDEIAISFETNDSASGVVKIEWIGLNQAIPDEETLKAEGTWKNASVIEKTDDETLESVSMETVEAGEITKFYYARVTDLAGNVGYIQSSGVLRDTTQPGLTVAYNQAAGTYNEMPVYGKDNNEVGFTLALSDDGISSGISDVTVSVTKVNKNNEEKNKTTTYNITSDIWTDTEENSGVVEAIRTMKKATDASQEEIAATAGKITGTLELDDGYYTVSVQAADKSGNTSEISKKEFIVDTKAPVIQIETDFKKNKDAKKNYYTGGTVTISVTDMTLVTEVDKLIELDTEWTSTTADDGTVTYTTTVKFGVKGTYGLDVNAKDALGREGVYDENSASKEDTKNFVIDNTAPTYTVSFSDPAEGSLNEGETYYYNGDITATFTITEDTSYDLNLIDLTVKNASGDSVITLKNGKISTDETSTGYSGMISEDGKTIEVTIAADADNHATDDDGYTFEISGKDKAGNKLEAGKPGENEEELDSIDRTCVMDTVVPVIRSVDYTDVNTKDEVVINERNFINKDTVVTVTMEEHNPVLDTNASVKDSKDNVVKGSTADAQWTQSELDVYTTKATVNQLGDGDSQTVTLPTIKDRAGNVAVLAAGDDVLRKGGNTKFENGTFTDTFTVDHTIPQVSVEYTKYNPDRTDYGVDYFSGIDRTDGVTVKYTVVEHNFDADLLELDVAGGKADSDSEWEISEADTYVRTLNFKKDAQYDITLEGIDKADNAINLKDAGKTAAQGDAEKGIITLSLAIDSKAPAVGDNRLPQVTITPVTKAQGKDINGHPLYNSNVTYEISVNDPLVNNYASGINAVVISAVGEDGTKATATVDRAGKITSDTGMTVSMAGDTATLGKGNDKYVFTVTLNKNTFNTNNIELSATAQDIATNEKSAKAQAVSIDITKPTVVVSYDNNDVRNGKYFKANRTATITVTERNFDNSCLSFIVNSKGNKLQFTKTSDGSGNHDNRTWRATYSFTSDGDYKIDGTVRDLATNAGTISYTGAAPQDFTVDKTKPVISISFDNNKAFNQSYYDAARTATITIVEHNFNGAEVKVSGTANEAGKAVSYPGTSGWSSGGDTRRASIHYSADAKYTLDVEYTDLAGNVADKPATQTFTVDKTAPVVTLTDVQHSKELVDGAAFNADCTPQIAFNDNHYATSSVTITRTVRDIKDKDVTSTFLTKNEGVESNGAVSSRDSVVSYSKTMQNPESKEGNDGLYTLTVTVEDMSGHKVEKKATYSVNRFGSVYVYSDDLRELSEQYVQKASGDLYVTAYNPNRLESAELELVCDGAAVSGQKSKADLKSGTQAGANGWYEYKFAVNKSDLSSDGRYEVKLSDKDTAGNTKTNSAHPLGFYVDATAPTLDSVIGLEDAVVNSDKQDVTYTASDAIGLSEIEVYVGEEKQNPITEFDDIRSYNGEFTINESSGRQHVRLVVTDKAGNVLDTDDSKTYQPSYTFCSAITVSKNIFVLWYAHTALFWSSIVAIAAIVGLILFVLFRRKKKEE